MDHEMNTEEKTALEYAGDMAGEYIESLNTADLTKFTESEWQTLLLVIVNNFRVKLSEVTINPPF